MAKISISDLRSKERDLSSDSNSDLLDLSQQTDELSRIKGGNYKIDIQLIQSVTYPPVGGFF